MKLFGQGSNYLFRGDPQRFREKFQQLEGMRKRFKPPSRGLGPKCYPNTRKWYNTVFGVRYKRFVELECKQKLRGFPVQRQKFQQGKF